MKKMNDNNCHHSYVGADDDCVTTSTTTTPSTTTETSSASKKQTKRKLSSSTNNIKYDNNVVDNDDNDDGNCNVAGNTDDATSNDDDDDDDDDDRYSDNDNDNDNVTLSDFQYMDESHPYGVLPSGNRWFDNDTNNNNNMNNSMILSDTLNDEIWYHIYTYMNSYDLIQSQQCCKYLYIISNQYELWRDLVLRKLETNRITHKNNKIMKQKQEQQLKYNEVVEEEKKYDEHVAESSTKTNNKNSDNNDDLLLPTIITHAGPTWKDTYMKLFHSSLSCHNNNNHHKPIKLNGIYSDYLYRLHQCRSFHIPKYWYNNKKNHNTKTCNENQNRKDNNKTKKVRKATSTSNNINSIVDCVDVNDMTIHKFYNEYEKRNIPVVITNGAKNWNATNKWNNLQYLYQHCHSTTATTRQQEMDCSVNEKNNPSNNQRQKQQQRDHQEEQEQFVYRATSGMAPLPASFTFAGYYEYATQQSISTLTDNTSSPTTSSHVDITTNTISSYDAVGDNSDVNEYQAQQEQEQEQIIQHHEHIKKGIMKTTLHEEGPLYLFDRNALQRNTSLWDDYYNDLQRTCPYWDPDRIINSHNNTDNNDNDNNDNNNDIVGHDLFQLLGEGKRPDHTWLIIGPKRSGSVFHLDPNATHAWNACIFGIKRWIFYPPGYTPPGVYPSVDGDEVLIPLSVGEWILQYWNEHVKNKRNNTNNKKTKQNSDNDANNEQQKQQQYYQGPIEVTTYPGDIVFVPHGWWHMVINIDNGLNVAITHNYISYSNLSNVLHFLTKKQEQISGCRDRNDSIKPEYLYTSLINQLHIYCPKQLNNALAISDFTCAAWKTRLNDNDDNNSSSKDKLSIKSDNIKKTKKKKKNTMDHDNALLNNGQNNALNVMIQNNAPPMLFNFTFS